MYINFKTKRSTIDQSSTQPTRKTRDRVLAVAEGAEAKALPGRGGDSFCPRLRASAECCEHATAQRDCIPLSGQLRITYVMLTASISTLLHYDNSIDCLPAWQALEHAHDHELDRFRPYQGGRTRERMR